MAPDPFRRPPMVDIPIAQGESIFWRFSNAMNRMVETIETYEPAEPWFLGWLMEKIDEAPTCPRCGCPPDRFCGCTPDACGCTPPTPPNPEPPMSATTGKTPDLHKLRRRRWYDENPITSTNTTSTGGSGMSIGDARQGMLGPIEKLNEALGAIQSGRAALEEAQAGLLQATEGSNQAEADQAHAQVAESLNKVDDAQQQIAQAMQEFEGVAQRL